MRRGLLVVGIFVSQAGCASLDVNEALGTMKNPPRVFNKPASSKNIEQNNPFIAANYKILVSAHSESAQAAVEPLQMRKYIGAGFALSDFYCSYFFRDADESQRRRKFARSAFNDTGTAIATILGLANAGENLVTGVAAGFGLGDNLWRSYDDAFVVNPDLSNVQQLVFAAQDNWRQRSLGDGAKLPNTYVTAQSVIMRYANFCSTLGMKALLNESATEQKEALKADTEDLQEDQDTGSPDKSNQREEVQRPPTANPQLAPG